MIRPAPSMTIAAALLLAACSREPAEPSPEATGSDPAAAPATQAPPPAEVTEPAAAQPSPQPTQASTVTAIPDPIRGRWGLVAADCTSKLGDAKGLLTISADQLQFYESVAKLGTIKEAESGRIRATFRYSGEGQTWTQDAVLDVQDGGKTLIRRDYGPDALPGPFTYTRCG